MVQVVTGDSQEEVLIFRDRQTLHHYIYININMMLIMTIFVMMVIMLLKMMYGINKRALVVKSRI